MDEGVETYGWQSQDAPASCDYLAPTVIDLLRRLGVRRVCDAGAGNGALAADLLAAGFYVAGADRDLEGVQIARRSHPSIHFYHLAMEHDPGVILAAEGDKFDAVVSTEVVEHLYDPASLPLFAGRLLSDNGHLLVSTPYHGYLKNVALSLLARWDQHHDPLRQGGHIKFWSRDTLTRLLEDNGFGVVAFRGVGRVPWLWKSMIIVAQKRA